MANPGQGLEPTSSYWGDETIRSIVCAIIEKVCPNGGSARTKGLCVRFSQIGLVATTESMSHIPVVGPPLRR